MKPLVILMYLMVCSCSALADDVERRYGLPDGLLARMQWHESRGGTGNYFVSDVVNAQQLRYLQKIANSLPRTPAHRMRGNHYGAMGVMQILLYGKYGSWQIALRTYTGSARYAEKIMTSLSP